MEFVFSLIYRTIKGVQLGCINNLFLWYDYVINLGVLIKHPPIHNTHLHLPPLNHNFLKCVGGWCGAGANYRKLPLPIIVSSPRFQSHFLRNVTKMVYRPIYTLHQRETILVQYTIGRKNIKKFWEISWYDMICYVSSKIRISKIRTVNKYTVKT